MLTEMIYRKVANRGVVIIVDVLYLAGRSWDSLLGGRYDTGKRKHFLKRKHDSALYYAYPMR